MSRAELWRAATYRGQIGDTSPRPPRTATDLPDSGVVIMARMHAFMAKSGKNIATLPNSKIGLLQKPKRTFAPRAKLPMRRAEDDIHTTPSRPAWSAAARRRGRTHWRLRGSSRHRFVSATMCRAYLRRLRRRPTEQRRGTHPLISFVMMCASEASADILPISTRVWSRRDAATACWVA